MPEPRTPTLPNSASRLLLARQHPAPLLENAVRAPVDLGSCLVYRQAAALHHVFDDDLHVGGNALPLRHFRSRLDALELITKGPRVDVAAEALVVPRATPRRQVACERVKAQLNVALRQVLYELPRRLLPW